MNSNNNNNNNNNNNKNNNNNIKNNNNNIINQLKRNRDTYENNNESIDSSSTSSSSSSSSFKNSSGVYKRYNINNSVFDNQQQQPIELIKISSGDKPDFDSMIKLLIDVNNRSQNELLKINNQLYKSSIEETQLNEENQLLKNKIEKLNNQVESYLQDIKDDGTLINCLKSNLNKEKELVLNLSLSVEQLEQQLKETLIETTKRNKEIKFLKSIQMGGEAQVHRLKEENSHMIQQLQSYGKKLELSNIVLDHLFEDKFRDRHPLVKTVLLNLIYGNRYEVFGSRFKCRMTEETKSQLRIVYKKLSKIVHPVRCHLPGELFTLFDTYYRELINQN